MYPLVRLCPCACLLACLLACLPACVVADRTRKRHIVTARPNLRGSPSPGAHTNGRRTFLAQRTAQSSIALSQPNLRGRRA
jgi:hypothetical protein